MAIQTSAGASIAIASGLPATNDEAGFEALSFDTIGEVESIGEYGIVYNEVNYTALNNRRVRKFKGSYNPGNSDISLAIDKDDAGQTAAKAALNSDAEYSFQITFQDGSIDYYTGRVMSFTTNISGVDNMTMGNMQIGVNSEFVEVAAPTP